MPYNLWSNPRKPSMDVPPDVLERLRRLNLTPEQLDAVRKRAEARVEAFMRGRWPKRCRRG
jgi:hypothetical protein